MSFNLMREQLYELVWSEAMQKLGKQIGISDIALAKHCRKIGIPVPERGYWNKLQAGKKVIKIPLPARDLGTISRVEILGTLSAELRARIQGEPGVPDPHVESIELLTERFRKRVGLISVPRGFNNVHPAIAKLLAKDEEHRQKTLTERYYWRKPQFDTPFERRRLRFLNSLLLGFAKIGATGWVRGENAREHAVKVGDTSVEFSLDQPPHRRGERRAGSSIKREDKLCLILTHYEPPAGVTIRWEDREGLTLEDQITDVVVGMTLAAEQFHRDWLERQIAWERQRQEDTEREARKRKEDAERRERERFAAIERAKVDSLYKDAESWRTSANIREYVAAVLMATKLRTDSHQLEKWLKWALAESDKLDPIASGRAAEVIRGSIRSSDHECGT